MGIIGVSLLGLYVLAAIGGLLVLQWLVTAQTNPIVVGGGFVLTIVLVGYLSYRAGTARLLASLDATGLDRRRAPALHRRLDRLVEQMAVDRPSLRVADIGAPNALSLGGPRRHTIIFDRHLLELLSTDELEGIMAHELAHAESYDSLLKTLAVSTMQSIAGIVFILLLPITLVLTGLGRAIAWTRGRPGTWEHTVPGMARRGIELTVVGVLSLLTLALLAHSRRREFAADRRAAEVTRKPYALARALHKIDRATDPRWGILSPLYIAGEEERTMTRLLSTHPPMDDRIEHLLSLVDDHQIGA